MGRLRGPTPRPDRDETRARWGVAVQEKCTWVSRHLAAPAFSNLVFIGYPSSSNARSIERLSDLYRRIRGVPRAFEQKFDSLCS
jgi:hypothetical protein